MCAPVFAPPLEALLSTPPPLFTVLLLQVEGVWLETWQFLLLLLLGWKEAAAATPILGVSPRQTVCVLSLRSCTLQHGAYFIAPCAVQ